MSALNITVQRDGVIVVTDAAAFDVSTGVVVGFPTKAAALIARRTALNRARA